jgi:hypothetical protein
VLDLKVDVRVKGSQLKEILMEKDHETPITQVGRAEKKRGLRQRAIICLHDIGDLS